MRDAETWMKQMVANRWHKANTISFFIYFFITHSGNSLSYILWQVDLYVCALGIGGMCYISNRPSVCFSACEIPVCMLSLI